MEGGNTSPSVPPSRPLTEVATRDPGNVHSTRQTTKHPVRTGSPRRKENSGCDAHTSKGRPDTTHKEPARNERTKDHGRRHNVRAEPRAHIATSGGGAPLRPSVSARVPREPPCLRIPIIVRTGARARAVAGELLAHGRRHGGVPDGLVIVMLVVLVSLASRMKKKKCSSNVALRANPQRHNGHHDG